MDKLNKYKYSYEKTYNYCYQNTDILINKLNIINDKDLYNAERELVLLRNHELLDNPLKGNFDFIHLKNIHRFLFQDIYRWAGEIRNCNIAKNDLFCLSNHIENYATEIFNKLISKKYLIEYDFDNKIIELVKLFSDINALHPFREGNGRTQREFIEQLAFINGIKLDLTVISQEKMIMLSHEGLLGKYDNMISYFKKCSTKITKEEQIKKISNIILDKKIKRQLLEYLLD